MSRKAQPASREFDALVRAIGDCKSKAEEDAIISREVEVLKAHVKDPRLNERYSKEIIVRLIYVEMLGHDASWGHVTALRACSSKALLTKKVAYLASTLFLDSTSELIVLIVNTLTRDLADDNFIIVCTALTVVTKLIGPDMIAAVLPKVVSLLGHPREIVRKKAVAALHHFEQLDPMHDGPLAGADVESHLCRMLCDKDPSVMGAVLCVLGDIAPRDPASFRNLAPSFASILKQITDGMLNKTYEYHRVPAPFLQIKLLRLLAIVGAGDVATSEAMYGVVGSTMAKASTSNSTIGNAIVYEAARTIATIHPNTSLLQSAGDHIATFLKASSHNLKYIGVDVLARMVRINPKYAAEHQLAVVDCLEDKDDALRKKTLELLYKMAKPNNVEVIVEKMVDYLRSCGDEVAKADVVHKISDLAERYAPDTFWFIDTMNHVFELGGDAVPASMAANLTRLIAEGGADGSSEGVEQMRSEVVASYLDLLTKPKLSDVLLTVILWVLGEYGSLADIGAQGVLSALGTLSEQRPPSEFVKGYLLTAIAKLTAQSGVPLPPSAQLAVDDAAASRNVDLQQRAIELQALLRSAPVVRQVALPPDASAEDVDVDPKLPFLDGFVAAAVQRGAAPYLPAPERRQLGAVRNNAHDDAVAAVKPINFTAYERPVMPQLKPPPAIVSETGLAGVPANVQTGAQSSTHTAAASAAAPPPPMLLRKAGGGRWGPPPSAQPSAPPAAPSSSHTATQGVTQQQSAYGGSSVSHPGAPPVPPPRPSETAEQLAQRAEKGRRAAALFGGGGGGSSRSSSPHQRHPRLPTATAGAATAAAQPRPHQKQPQEPAEAELMSVESPTASRSQSPAAPKPAASGGDLLGDLQGLDINSTSNAGSQPVLHQQAEPAFAQQQPQQHGAPDLASLLGSPADSLPQQHHGTANIAAHNGVSRDTRTNATSADLLGLSAGAKRQTPMQQPSTVQQPRPMRQPRTAAPSDPFADLM